jgi:hypothetical protein
MTINLSAAEKAAMEELRKKQEAAVLEKLHDFNWRIRNLYYILDKNGNTVLFRPNEVQEEFINDIWHRNIVPKARQRGFSTVVQLMILDSALFNPNQICAIIAQDKETASKIMRQKIKFAYSRLPKFIQRRCRVIRNNTKELGFANGSSVQVSTSARGDTLNFLHISEFGIICYYNPERAQEIITGSLPAAAQGITVIESTAKGRDGAYYKMVMEAKGNAEAKKKLARAEYRIHFASWWDADEYEMDPSLIVVPVKDHLYFDQMERVIGRPISAPKRAWYVATRRNDFADDDEMMWAEYPTTIDEAFKVSQEGVYLTKQISNARLSGRITKVPYNPLLPVNTFWDLGLNDDIAIWFHQLDGLANNFIDYFECSDQPYDYIIGKMQAKPYSVYGHHFLPHDGDQRRPGLHALKTPKDMLADGGLRNLHIVPRVTDLVGVGIQQLRSAFSSYYFDETNCDEGIKHLENYKKQWISAQGAWGEHPAKNGHQHAADALRQHAQFAEEVKRLCSISGKSQVPNRSNKSGRVA